MTALNQWKCHTLFFLTDGLPTVGETSTKNIEEAVAYRNANAQTQIFCIGLQVNEAEEFLSSLSVKNGGALRMVD